MKNELLPILAAYLGQKCSYNGFYVDFGVDYELKNIKNLKNFKLHLRKPSQITNEELRTLSGIVCGIEYEPETYFDTRVVKDSDGDAIVLLQSNGVIELGIWFANRFAETTNYLRSIGICVDEVLIKEGLIQFDGEEVGSE